MFLKSLLETSSSRRMLNPPNPNVYYDGNSLKSNQSGYLIYTVDTEKYYSWNGSSWSEVSFAESTEKNIRVDTKVITKTVDAYVQATTAEAFSALSALKNHTVKYDTNTIKINESKLITEINTDTEKETDTETETEKETDTETEKETDTKIKKNKAAKATKATKITNNELSNVVKHMINDMKIANNKPKKIQYDIKRYHNIDISQQAIRDFIL